MALADSMFLFEIDIKDLKSYTRCKKIKIIGQFADVFKEYVSPTAMPFSKKTRTRNVRDKVKKSNLKLKKSESKIRTYASQSILIINKSSKLVSLMKKYPLEIIISKEDSEQYLGSTIIPWNNEYLSYLTKKSVFPPACTEREYKVYDELTRKRIVTFKMSLKLTHIRSISNKLGTLLNSKKYKMKNNESLIDASAESQISISHKEMFPSVNCNKISHKPILLNLESFKKLKYKAPNISCSKSDLNTAKKRKNTLDFENSCSSIDYKNRYNLFRYIFGDPMGCFGNKVYQVGYFTVETDVSGQSSPKVVSGDQSPEKSTESKKKLTFKKCDSECLSKGFGSCSDNAFTLDLPEEVANLTSVTKCKEVTCNYKKHKELPPPPDDRILLDVTSLKNDCCTKVTEKVEEVVGGVIANIKIGHDPCYCTCECGMFSFTKTTYCTICGGYEIAGDDGIGKTALEAPMPCPIFHKLVDKNKLKTWSTSGSESKKKGDDQRSIRSSQSRRPTVSEKKSIESEKGKKKKKDDRFKFNYGYKAPQIGHSKCAFPCTGTLDNVPKRMGWLWSAENVPGLKVPRGWRPGAISHKLFRMLKKAKSNKSTAETVTRTKRAKKQVEDKPTLIVCKQNGQYRVELQASPDNQEEFQEQYTPLIYRIESLNNKAKLKKKEKIQRQLVRAAVNEVWSDPFDPEACENVCLPAYKHAVGDLLESGDDRVDFQEHNIDDSNSCSLEDEEISSSCDSSDVEWEIRFTPPFVSHQKSKSEEKNYE